MPGTRLFKEDRQTILSMVTPSPVIATVNVKCDLLEDSVAGSRIIKTLDKDQSVEIIRDISLEWYHIIDLSDNKKGWVTREVLDIPPDPETNTTWMNKRQLESYVNIVGLKSDTSFLVWTDIDRQLTHIFESGESGWRLDRTFICSTGRNISPTIRGTYKIKDRGSWFYSDRLKSGARYWVRFEGPFLFHSIPMDQEKNIIDDGLGKRLSNGCIRMSIENAAWFYRTVPEGSTIYVD